MKVKRMKPTIYRFQNIGAYLENVQQKRRKNCVQQIQYESFAFAIFAIPVDIPAIKCRIDFKFVEFFPFSNCPYTTLIYVETLPEIPQIPPCIKGCNIEPLKCTQKQINDQRLPVKNVVKT